ncbi:MAG: DUF2764 family protein [Gammaproteobacteria bacterium]|nr:DUF2764 family protein [Gammaproteobacteria bacterium]
MMPPDYTELICSLPHLVDPFKYQRQSISFVQLQKRMNMLQYDDYRWISQFLRLFYWGEIRLDVDEEQLVRAANRFMDEVPCPDIKYWLLWRMDVRTIIAALRRRRDGETAPLTNDWGFGRYLHHIRSNWSAPCFKLEHRFTFLPQVNQLLAAGESYSLEKVLLEAIWDFFSNCSPRNSNGLAMVVLYLLKWNLIEQWSQCNSTTGAERFDNLVTSCMPQTLDFNKVSNDHRA